MSFAIALSGLNAATADLSATANNIANANTTGFKSSRAQFGDVYSASASGISSNNTIGSGVRVERISQQFGQGTINFTNSSLDLALSGEGFFTVSDNGATVYTRNGAFGTDAQGFLVNQAGQRLQVFPALATGGFNTGALSDLQLSVADNPPAATTSMSAMFNLPADAQPPAVGTFDANDPDSYNNTTSVTVYDSLGATHSANIYFVKGAAAGAWDLYATVDGTQLGGATALQYDNTGFLTTPAGGQITLSAFTPSDGAADINMTLDIGQSTQFGSNFGVSSLTQNGFASGRLSGVEITQEGVIQARYTNGQATPLGEIALTTFANPQGLQQLGNTSWGETFASGAAVRGVAGSANFGLLQSGALEASNVDLTAQLVNMITAQRNFQANAQMIQTSDQITQTIINIR
jgi:flagellar hook protein FlgE